MNTIMTMIRIYNFRHCSKSSIVSHRQQRDEREGEKYRQLQTRFSDHKLAAQRVIGTRLFLCILIYFKFILTLQSTYAQILDRWETRRRNKSSIDHQDIVDLLLDPKLTAVFNIEMIINSKYIIQIIYRCHGRLRNQFLCPHT